MEPLSNRLSSLLEESGAVAFGAAEAKPVEDSDWRRFQSWLESGFHAGMAYMENYPEIRRDPRMLLQDASTVISIAYNYRQPNPYRGVATYALGRDYHKVLRRLLKGVVRRISEEFGGAWRICIDSAPILERYWAERCGVGRRSDVHGNIIVPGVGSMVFLAELITTHRIENLSFQKYVASAAERQGCDGPALCPTGALQPGGMVDSRRCINYLTIEKREELSPEEELLRGDAVFGCDICQRACRENRGECIEVMPEFKPLPGLGEFLRGESSGFDLQVSPLSRSRRFRRE